MHYRFIFDEGKFQLISTGAPHDHHHLHPTPQCSVVKKDKHSVIGLNNPKVLHFSNHNRGVIYTPVTRIDLDPDWAQRRHAIDLHNQESQLPLKPWQWNCTTSIGSVGAPPYYL